MVYTSVSTGKLFHSREGVVEDFCENQIKSIPMRDVTTQNRFEIQEEFLAFIQTHLEESKIAAFVEALSQYEPFAKHVERWMEEGAEETEAEEEEE
jgi:protein involved in ribonucleotide reduction